jgi:predicted DNA-binding ribbon-helix-helix protein
MTKKVCVRCGQEKEIDEFYKNYKAKDKRTSWCKVCYKSKSKHKHIKGSTLEQENFELRQIIERKDIQILQLIDEMDKLKNHLEEENSNEKVNNGY